MRTDEQLNIIKAKIQALGPNRSGAIIVECIGDLAKQEVQRLAEMFFKEAREAEKRAGELGYPCDENPEE